MGLTIRSLSLSLFEKNMVAVGHEGKWIPQFSFPSPQFTLTKQKNLFPFSPLLFFSCLILQTKHSLKVIFITDDRGWEEAATGHGYLLNVTIITPLSTKVWTDKSIPEWFTQIGGDTLS